MNKILIVAAHNDDEILGCGSTLRKHILSGDEVYCLILGEGAICRELEGGNLIKQSQQAGKIIGFKEMFFKCLPDNRFDTIPQADMNRYVEQYINKINPSIVYTHHKVDLNKDHRITYESVIVVCRPINSTVKEIYSFETPSSTEWTFDYSFKPNVFVDIKYTLETKLEATKCYTTELREYPFPRSIEALKVLAQYRGIIAGLEYAEAFELIRSIK
jgi:LmbE family N-acetylglucosaminyl deacetylase